MEGLQGAVLGVQLPHLTAWNQRRRAIAHRYHELLKDTPLRLPIEAAWAESVYHLYVVRHAARDRLKAHLEQSGVGTALHYPHPLHLQKCFAQFGHQPGDFPVAERAARECLSLPIYPELTDEQVDFVAASIRQFQGW
jgi:dTDP-4-amino-4,6-dideoxygalactose transaminase